MPLNQQPPKDYHLIKSEDEKQRKGLEDIVTLKKLLKSRRRNDLAILLEGCSSEVEESSQYGSYTFSIISTFWFYVPPEKIEKLEQISGDDKNLLLELVRKIYPPREYSPEIREVQFRVLTKDIKGQEDKQLQRELPKSQLKESSLIDKIDKIIEKCLISEDKNVVRFDFRSLGYTDNIDERAEAHRFLNKLKGVGCFEKVERAGNTQFIVTNPNIEKLKKYRDSNLKDVFKERGELSFKDKYLVPIIITVIGGIIVGIILQLIFWCQENI